MGGKILIGTNLEMDIDILTLIRNLRPQLRDHIVCVDKH